MKKLLILKQLQKERERERGREREGERERERERAKIKPLSDEVKLRFSFFVRKLPFADKVLRPVLLVSYYYTVMQYSIAQV